MSAPDTGQPGEPVAQRGSRRRVLLVDDHPIVLRGLRRLIENEADLEVCAEAEGVHEARATIRRHQPDLAVVDISLKDGDGLELVKDLRAQYPTLPVLVLSMHDESVYAERMLAAGANGYIMKQAASEQFMEALRKVLAGGIYVSDTLQARLARSTTRGELRGSQDPIGQLSNRELQILRMIGRGRSTRQVADALNLSIKTIEAHRQRIKHKLGLKTGAQLVNFAISWSN